MVVGQTPTDGTLPQNLRDGLRVSSTTSRVEAWRKAQLREAVLELPGLLEAWSPKAYSYYYDSSHKQHEVH